MKKIEMLRDFVKEIAQKGHRNSMQEDAQTLLDACAPEKNLLEFVRLITVSHYCSCNYCEEKTAARIILRDYEIEKKRKE